MLPLDDPTWSQLKYAGGDGSNLPNVIRRLEAYVDSDMPLDDDLMEDLSETCHQWSTYDATIATVPHLVDVSTRMRASNPARIELLAWIGWCVACVELNQTTASDTISSWFKQSVSTARDLIAESLPHVDANENTYSLRTTRSLLAAFAACHGNTPLSFVLSELEEGGTKCEYCGRFFEPMKSSLNPFFEHRDGR